MRGSDDGESTEAGAEVAVAEQARAARMAEAERRLASAAGLMRAEEVSPGPVPLPDFAALRARRARRRRIGLALGMTAAAASTAMLVLGLRGDPISFAVEGASVSYDGAGGVVIDGPAPGPEPSRPARIRFSEGTEVGIERGGTLKVLDRTRRGAEMAVERGRASFSVVRRTDARWAVRAGPFVVAVTGTRFSVDWSPRDQHLIVDLTAGAVIVRGGAAAEDGVAVRPGERLEAYARTGQLTVRPIPHPEPEPRSPSSSPSPAPSPPSPAAPAAAAALAPALPAPPAPVKKVVIGPTRRSAALSPGRAAAAAPPVDGDPATTPWLMPDLQPMPEQSAIGAQPGPRTRLAAFSPPSPVLGGGRGQCAAAGPGSGTRYRFEDPEPGVSVAQFYMLSFSMPRIDSTHSWCGRSSLRVDATFHENGRRNFFGRLPYQTGQVIVQLPRSVDFSGKTVTMQVFVEGPSDVRVSALPVVIHRGAWVPGEMLENVAPDRWWTVSSRFEKENPIPGGTTSGVFDCNRVALIIYNSGKDRGRQTWNGAVYVDEIAWR